MNNGGGRVNIWDGDAHSVRVAVRARPLSAREKVDDATECVQTIDREQIKLGSKYFTFDVVYDNDSRQEIIYDECVSELVKSCLGGYNATILAYGQTGSGKTFTMGSTSVGAVLEEEQGIIPRAIRQIFDEMTEKQQQNDSLNFKLHVSFLEIYNEEIKDLLDTQPRVNGKNKHLNLREGPNGSIQVMGVSEEQVSSYEDMLQCLEKGTVCRSVGSTSMNAVSSRSHAIFTVTIEQTFDPTIVCDLENADPNAEPVSGAGEGAAVAAEDGGCSASIVSKFHFVDLAGSERVKRTQAAGDRLKEGININYGLLVLGNVISALGDETRKGSHVPYRDSKLTRMLQDSIGGNSRTLMIACISPADSNFAESYNSLVYANRARNIQNKPVVNRDPREAELARMRETIARLQAERDAALKHAGVGQDEITATVAEARSLKPGREAALVGELKTSREDAVKLLARLEKAETSVKVAAESEERHRAAAVAAALARDKFRARLEEALGKACPEEEEEGGSEGGGGGKMVVEEQAATIEELRKALEAERHKYRELSERYQKREKELEQDHHIFSAKNKKIEVLAKQNNALKAEKHSIIRMSMSPAVARSSSLAPGEGSEKRRGENGGPTVEDSPSALSDHRKRLEGVLRDQEEGAQEGGGVEEWAAESGEDEHEAEPGETEAVDAVLAEEEERRWRQGLLQKEVEVRDLSTAIDSKEKLLEQLMRSQAEYDKMKTAYEVRMQAASAAVRSAEEDAHKAQDAVCKVKTLDEQEKQRLVKEHLQRVKDLEAKVARLRREEKDYSRWVKQRERDQDKIRTLQDEINSHKQSKAAAVRKMKEDADKYREWRERHHREVQQLKRTAQKAEYALRRLERDNARLKAVLKRREEEKAAAQRQNREMALANARIAKTEKVSAASSGTHGGGGSFGGGGGQESVGHGRPASSGNGNGMRTRSQVVEKVDRFKMNRARLKLKNMIEEYGQRGKLQAELARLKGDSKTIFAEVKELRARRDRLQLRCERRRLTVNGHGHGHMVNGVGQSVREAWGDGRQSVSPEEREREREEREREEEEGDASEEEVQSLTERLEEKETRLDYNRERTQEVERTLKGLPDFDGAAGVWTDDDAVEVPEAYEAIREANGAEARSLLRFLFKKAALFREAENRVRAQAELQRVAIEEQRRERDQALGALRRAELSFEHRCTQLQASHEHKCLLLYSKLNHINPAASDPGASMEDSTTTPQGSASPYTPSSASARGSASPQAERTSGVMATPSSGRGTESIREVVRMRNEELMLLRAMNEGLRAENESLKQAGGVAEDGNGRGEAGVLVPEEGGKEPSECVRGMSERITKLKRVIHSGNSSAGSASTNVSNSSIIVKTPEVGGAVVPASGDSKGPEGAEFEFREGDTDPTRLPFFSPKFPSAEATPTTGSRHAQGLKEPVASESPAGVGGAERASSSSEEVGGVTPTSVDGEEEGGGGGGRAAEKLVEETPQGKEFKVSVFERLTSQRNKVAQSKYKCLLKLRDRMTMRPVFVDWVEAIHAGPATGPGSHGEGPDARTPLPHHLGGAVGVGVAAEADKENFARPTPRMPGLGVAGLRRSQDEAEEGGDGGEGKGPSGDVALTPGVNRGNVFMRLQDPKSYTGIHKQNVDALLSSSEWKGGAPQSAGKAAQHGSTIKTPRQPRFTNDTPVRGGGSGGVGHSSQ